METPAGNPTESADMIQDIDEAPVTANPNFVRNLEEHKTPFKLPPIESPNKAGNAAAASSLSVGDITTSIENLSTKELVQVAKNIATHDSNAIFSEIDSLLKKRKKYVAALETIDVQYEWAYKLVEKGENLKTRSFDEAEAHIHRQIERIEGEADELKKKIDTFETLKINETRDQKSAQRSITPKLVKKTYKYLKNHRDEIIIELLETYVACLRNKYVSGPIDVELYLRSKKGLDVAMNQVDPSAIKGENAKRYIDVIGQIRNNFKEGSKYVTYIPFLVWLNKTCHLIKWAIDEKKLVDEYDQKIATVNNLKALVDEIDALKDEGISIDSHDF